MNRHKMLETKTEKTKGQNGWGWRVKAKIQGARKWDGFYNDKFTYFICLGDERIESFCLFETKELAEEEIMGLMSGKDVDDWIQKNRDAMLKEIKELTK